jgi:hypothetical protein
MKCLRIFADESGTSHFGEIDIPLEPVELFPGVAPVHLSDGFTTTSIRFARVPAGMRMADKHVSPFRNLTVWLTGWVEFETSDGEVRGCDPGTVVLSEDTFGDGHISRHPEEGQYVILIAIPDDVTFS